MPWWSWLILTLLAVSCIWIVWFLVRRKPCCSSPKKSPLPQVCSVWDRWRELKEDLESGDEKKLGSAWKGNICPAGSLFQAINRRHAACIDPADRVAATNTLCQFRISNDEAGVAVPAQSDPALQSVDHWVRLKENLDLPDAGAVKKGDAWQDDLRCPTGALFQFMDDDEAWCVLPEQAVAAMNEAIRK